MRSKLEDLVDGVQELRLVWEHRDVSLHPAFRLVEGVGVDDNQLLKLGLLFLLKSKPQVKLLLEGPEVSVIKLEHKVLNYCHPNKIGYWLYLFELLWAEWARLFLPPFNLIFKNNGGSFIHLAQVTSLTCKVDEQSTNSSHTWIDIFYPNPRTRVEFNGDSIVKRLCFHRV